MTPTVVIEVAAAEKGTAGATIMVTACDSTVSSARCALAGSEGADEDSAAAVAIVTWLSADHLTAQIDVGLRGGEHAAWRTRTIQFRSEDALTERWRAVGFAIGTIVGALRAESEEASKPPAPPAPTEPPSASPPPSRPPAPLKPLATERLWIDLVGGVRLAPADRASFGAGLRLASALTPRFYVVVGSSIYGRARDERGLAMRFLSIGIGAGARVTSRRTTFAIEVGGAVQQLSASVSEPISGAADSASRWAPALVASAVAEWRWTGALGFTARATCAVTPSTTSVAVRNAVVNRVHPVGFELIFGPRLTF